jgi:hypothetical protein
MGNSVDLRARLVDVEKGAAITAAQIDVVKDPTITGFLGSGVRSTVYGEGGSTPQKDAKTIQEIMEEFNGSTIGNSNGIIYTNTINGQGAVFSRVKESRIEYPFSIGFPHEGTIEYLIKVYRGYSYSNYVLNDNLGYARIFDTGSQDVAYPGAMFIDVYDNGSINLCTMTTYGQNEFHNLKATGTDFAFNEWHTIGVSFGSQGQYIMLDGNIVAEKSSYTESLQTNGNFASSIDTPKDTPTVGELVSCFWANNRYDAGFEGVIDRFRVSEKQQDWYLSNTLPSQY